MAFKASSVIPANAYASIKGNAMRLRNYSAQIITLLQSDVSAQQFPGIVKQLSFFKGELSAVASTPGLAAYAQDQEGDPLYNVVNEYIGMIAAIDAAIATIQATNTNALISAWTLDGIAWNSFTAVQTAGLRADLQSIVDSIE